jgi:AAA domain-containing protein
VAGLSKRLKAWSTAHRVREVPRFYSIADAPQLASEGDVRQLIADVRAQIPEPTSLVIIDTMARCFVGGEENSAKDVGRLIAGADHLAKELKCTVLLVHHTTKSGESERGSSALRGAPETMISLDSVGDDITVTCEKQKNAPPFGRFALQLVPSSESCVLQPTEAASPDPTRLGSQELAGLRALGTFGSNGARSGEWLRATGLSQSTFYRHRLKLVQGEYVDQQGDRYYLTEGGKTAVAATPSQLSEN